MDGQAVTAPRMSTLNRAAKPAVTSTPAARANEFLVADAAGEHGFGLQDNEPLVGNIIRERC